MMNRRNLLIGSLCVVSAGAAYAATPRKHLSLVGSAEMEAVLPRQFGDWASRDVSDALALNSPESLAAKLYSQIVTRLYSNTRTGEAVMMLVAYGAEQTDGLQLHRPEVCYPAFGYKLTHNSPFQLPLPGGAALPARRLVAAGNGRQEDLVYWSRIGESLPLDGAEQRRDRLRMAVQGVIPDGILARFSASSVEPGGSWPLLANFVASLLSEVSPEHRKTLVGTARADQMRVATI
jgi:EpsI family protein